MTVSRSIHVSTNDSISFLLMTKSYFIVYMYQVFFIPSTVSELSGGFLVLAFVNSTAVNTGGHVSF